MSQKFKNFLIAFLHLIIGVKSGTYYSLHESTPVSNITITFGQSAAFTGGNSYQGYSINAGINAAFKELNDTNEVNGVRFNLVALDDGFNATRTVENLQIFLNDSTIYAFAGITGTGEVIASIPVATAAKIPLIGSITGAPQLSSPFNKYIINHRGPYLDEEIVFIGYLAQTLKYKRISILYANDTNGSGVMCRNAALQALDSNSLLVFTESIIEGNYTATFSRLVRNNEIPEALLVFNTKSYQETADLIIFGNDFFKTNITYGVASRNPPLAVSKSLLNNGRPDVIPKIIFTSIVPQPSLISDDPFVERFNAAINNYNITNIPNIVPFMVMEGYVIGRLIGIMFNRLHANITSDAYLDTIYETGMVYYSSDFYCGPLYPANVHDGCNSCMFKIWMTKVHSNLSVEDIPFSEASTIDCGFKPTQWDNLYFAQSTDITPGTYGYGIYIGLQAAFNEINSAGGLRGIKFRLVTLADNNSNTQSLSNTYTFINNDSIFALIGYTNLQSPSEILELAKENGKLLIGATNGIESLRNPFQSYAINLQPSYIKEIRFMIEYIYGTLGLRIVSLLYTDDEYGQEIYNCLSASLGDKLLQIHSYQIYNPTAIITEINLHNVTSKSNPEAIFLGNSISSHNVKLFCLAKSYYPKALFLSTSNIAYSNLFYDIYTTCSESIDTKFDMTTDSFLFTHYLTFPEINSSCIEGSNCINDTNDIISDTLISNYRNAIYQLTSTIYDDFPSLQGYITGRLTIEIITRYTNNDFNTDEIIDLIYNALYFRFDSVTLGPYESDVNKTIGCSNGFQNIFIHGLNMSTGDYYHIKKNGKQVNITYTDCNLDAIKQYNVETYTLRLAIAIVATIFALSVFIISCLLCKFRNYFMIKPSFKFSILSCIGCIMNYLSIYTGIFIATDKLCQQNIIMKQVAFIFMFGPLIVKTRRLSAIFNNKQLRRIRISDNQVLCQFLIIFIVLISVLNVWFIFYTPYASEEYFYNLNGTALRYMNCNMNKNAFYEVLFIGELILLAYAAVLCFRIQGIAGVYSHFNESKQIGLCIYNSCCFGCLSMLLDIIIHLEPNVTFALQSIFLLCTTTMLPVLLFLIPVKNALLNKSQEEVEGKSTDTKVSANPTKKPSEITGANYATGSTAMDTSIRSQKQKASSRGIGKVKDTTIVAVDLPEKEA